MSAAGSTTDMGLGIALVTGSTSGIGRATALRLAEDGWNVIVHGRNSERGADVVREIEAPGGRARFVAADLKNVAAVQNLVEGIGDVDVLVNNAGDSWFGPTADLDEATFDNLSTTTCGRPISSWPASLREWRHGPPLSIGDGGCEDGSD